MSIARGHDTETCYDGRNASMGFQSLKDILPGAIEGLGIATQVREGELRRAWPVAARTVSAELARASVVGLRDGRLLVHVRTAWLARLVVERQADLIAALAQVTGEAEVRQVIATVANPA